MSELTTAGVVACYNHEDYIAEAVESLIHQVDELVVIDDFSVDSSAAILDALDYPNLRVIHNEQRRGVSLSYNRAVAMTSADILLIQGGDDRSLPDRSERQRDAFEDPAVVLSYSLPRVIDAAGRVLPDSVAGEFLIGRSEIDPLKTLFFGSNYICAPAAAVRRVDYLRHGGFRAGLELLQDYDLWLSLAAEGRFSVIEEPVVEYRKHGSNLSREYVGIDSPKRRRFVAEQEYIREHFLRMADDATVARLAGLAGLSEQLVRDLERADVVALIQLSHPDKVIVRQGLRRLFELAGGADGLDRLATMGVSVRDFAEFTIRADHENLEGVSRALAAVNTVERLSNPQH